MAAPRSLPQRTCVVCRSTTVKRQLVRVVRTPSGVVEIDPTGKKNGRGAYLCRRSECWEAALKKDRLGAALKVKIGPDARSQLAAFAATLADATAITG